MVDYSKWDALEVSDNEDEDSVLRPKVTRLDEASTVTWGGAQGDGSISILQSSAPREPRVKQVEGKSGCNVDPASSSELPTRRAGAAARQKEKENPNIEKNKKDHGKNGRAAKSDSNAITAGYAKWDKILAEYDSVSDEEKNRSDDEESVTDSESDTEPNEKSALPPPRPRSAAAIRVDDPGLRRNGGLVDEKYVWSQSKHEVLVNFFVPGCTRGKDVTIAASKWHLYVKIEGEVFVEGRLCYPVERPESLEDKV
uniref:CS domain-containing protein n=1 Tax=Octactis speculum TaxID=3111310 RepID=A0A7S2APU8_9STRA|mmetsp:Transcript_13062/g.17183  ORF Transcript_13062/g.17183 Transcript_13062/m.17183 type:complete len:255 (+) Transcript_13062:31-795(+)